MKYFLHDSNAFNDEKITQLFMEYGYEGLGLFYTALEKFASQEKPIDTKVLHNQLHLRKRLLPCWNFMEKIGIICSSNGESFNKELLNFSEKYRIKKEKTAKRVAEFRARHENVTHYERVTNARKVKESKVNNKDLKIGAFAPPTIDEILSVIPDKPDAEDFFDYYCSNGWKVGGRAAMKDWRAAARRWERNNHKPKIEIPKSRGFYRNCAECGTLQIPEEHFETHIKKCRLQLK